MAITKIHPIRRTLGKAVKYITDPGKTEEELFVSCFSCAKETIVYEFNVTHSHLERKSPVLAQHLIQSFKAGEVDAKTAHDIGKELADSFLNGRHEYIIATHLDRGHIHNHIIFNHVSFVDRKCFHSDADKLRQLRKLNDEICLSHGLSVVNEPRGKGRTYYEWAMDKLDRSYKKKLKDNIDMLIPKVSSYAELLNELKRIGYEVKVGKYDSFRLTGQERFTRSKTLGAEYTKEAIVKRIESRLAGTYASPVKKPAYIRIFRYDQSIGLIENTGNYLLFIKSAYARERAAIIDVFKFLKILRYSVIGFTDHIG